MVRQNENLKKEIASMKETHANNQLKIELLHEHIAMLNARMGLWDQDAWKVILNCTDLIGADIYFCILQNYSPHDT